MYTCAYITKKWNSGDQVTVKAFTGLDLIVRVKNTDQRMG